MLIEIVRRARRGDLDDQRIGRYCGEGHANFGHVLKHAVDLAIINLFQRFNIGTKR
nr:hypothetical protein [Cohaesibacter haloalkalitolerans]